MPHKYSSPPEKHVLRRLKHLVLNDDVPNEESIPEETNDSLAMGKKRGNYLCKEVSRHSTARVPLIAWSRGPPTRFVLRHSMDEFGSHIYLYCSLFKIVYCSL